MVRCLPETHWERYAVTTAEIVVSFILYVTLTAAIAAGSWRCFRRTRVGSFLFLGAVLILWPWLDAAAGLLLQHFLDQALAGQRPWLFPFSLIAMGSSWGAGEMTPGEFITKFGVALQLLHFALLALALILVARSLKRRWPQRPNP